MTFETVADLPKGVRNTLPPDGQRMWLAIFNHASEAGKEEADALLTAWGGVKKRFARTDNGWLPRAIEEVDKYDQEEVCYETSGFKGINCGNCRWIDGAGCHLVEGQIDPLAVCMMFEPAEIDSVEQNEGPEAPNAEIAPEENEKLESIQDVISPIKPRLAEAYAAFRVYVAALTGAQAGYRINASEARIAFLEEMTAFEIANGASGHVAEDGDKRIAEMYAVLEGRALEVGQGNWGHKGRKGQIGGSAPGAGGGVAGGGDAKKPVGGNMAGGGATTTDEIISSMSFFTRNNGGSGFYGTGPGAEKERAAAVEDIAALYVKAGELAKAGDEKAMSTFFGPQATGAKGVQNTLSLIAGNPRGFSEAHGELLAEHVGSIVQAFRDVGQQPWGRNNRTGNMMMTAFSDLSDEFIANSHD